MPNKIRIYPILLISLTSLLLLTGLALAAPARPLKRDTPGLSNRTGLQASQQVDHLAGAGNQIFLPIVSNRPAGIPVPNGDFESGPAIWTEFSTNSRNLILFDNDLPVTPHSGSWAVWLGGAKGEISYIEQVLTVPVGSPHFTYWHWKDSEENTCGFDFGGVIVNKPPNEEVYVYDLCTNNNTSGWVDYSVDLSGYTGQSMTVQIWAETNNNDQVSNLYVDDVTFNSYPATTSLIKTRRIKK